MKLRSIPYVFMAVGVIASASYVSAQSEESIELKIHLEPGARYVIEKDSEQIIEQTMMDEQVQMAQSISTKNALLVESIADDGVMTLKTSLESVKVSILSTGGQTQEFDSENSGQKLSPLAKTYRPFLNKEFRVLLTQRGDVLEVMGVDEIFVQLFEDDDIHQLQNQAYVEKIKEMFGDKGVREMIENIFAVYPDTAVSKGDVWLSEYALPNSLFPITVKSQSRFSEMAGGVVTVEVESVLTTAPQESEMMIEDVNVAYDIHSGSQYSVNRFSKDSGWIVAAETTQDISAVMTMTMNGAKDIPDELQELTIPMTIQSNIKVRSKKVN